MTTITEVSQSAVTNFPEGTCTPVPDLIPFTLEAATSHAPGPWRQYQSGAGIDPCYRNIDAGAGFFEPGRSFGLSGFMTPADAALIAAAPDLLNALHAVANALEWHENQTVEPGQESGALDLARAAIAKAEGRS